MAADEYGPPLSDREREALDVFQQVAHRDGPIHGRGSVGPAWPGHRVPQCPKASGPCV